jgi:hypothetical protein
VLYFKVPPRATSIKLLACPRTADRFGRLREQPIHGRLPRYAVKRIGRPLELVPIEQALDLTGQRVGRLDQAPLILSRLHSVCNLLANNTPIFYPFTITSLKMLEK